MTTMEISVQEKLERSGKKGILQILGNIARVHHETIKDEGKQIKRTCQENERVTGNKPKLLEPYKRINNLTAPPLVRYSGSYLKGNREKLKQMDQKTRKLMTMYKALYPRDDVDGLYVSRKEGGTGLVRIENGVDTSIQWLKNSIEKHTGRPLTAIWNNTDNTRINRTKIIGKIKREEKQLYGQLKRQTTNISHEKTWTWLRKGNLKEKLNLFK